jgi:hypothetical protein
MDLKVTLSFSNYLPGQGRRKAEEAETGSFTTHNYT